MILLSDKWHNFIGKKLSDLEELHEDCLKTHHRLRYGEYDPDVKRIAREILNTDKVPAKVTYALKAWVYRAGYQAGMEEAAREFERTEREREKW